VSEKTPSHRQRQCAGLRPHLCGVPAHTELDSALIFLDLAEVSQIPENVTRNRQNALAAYRTFLRLRGAVRPDARQQEAIDDKLRLLKKRFWVAGNA